MSVFPEPSRGLFDGTLHRFAVTVYYEDTDAGGVVYHANYLRWYERARTDMLTLLGMDQRTAVEAGQGLYVVADVAMRFHAPARLGDTILIETRLEELLRASVRLTQVARRGETKLNEARIRVGFVAPDGRPRRQPDEWHAAFLPYVHQADRQDPENGSADAEQPERQQ